MDTKEYIEILKKNTHEPIPAAFRNSLCKYLYDVGISCRIIAEVMHCKRRHVYRQIYNCRDMVEVNDDLMRSAYEETKKHKIVVKPTFLDADVITRFSGYKMLIDNQIY